MPLVNGKVYFMFIYLVHTAVSISWAAIVHLNFRVGSTFPVPVCTVPHGLWVNKADNINRTNRCNKVDAVRLYTSFMFNLLLLKGQLGA